MLRILKEEEFDQYVDFAYALALDTARSGYPTYADGIKTKQDFIDRSRKAFTRENEEILLFEQNGRISGWIHYYCLPEDHYVDTCSFCISEGVNAAAAEFVHFVRGRFPGCECYLGFPAENQEAASALEDLGFERIEESYNDVLDFRTFTGSTGSRDIIPITQDNYPVFSALHDQQQDMYWNSERIRNAMDEWRIYACVRNGEAVGAIYFMIWDDLIMDEIFGVDFVDDIYDRDVFRELMMTALAEDKRRGVRYMVFFSEEESQADALSCGFHCIGKYKCFKKTL